MIIRNNVAVNAYSHENVRLRGRYLTAERPKGTGSRVTHQLLHEMRLISQQEAAGTEHRTPSPVCRVVLLGNIPGVENKGMWLSITECNVRLLIK